MSNNRVVVQRLGSKPEQITVGAVDVLIGAATWDRRCLSITEVGLPASIPHVLLLRYADRGSSGRVDEHESALYRRLAPIADYAPSPIEIDSADLVAAWLTVRRAILGVYESVRRPLRVAVDLNSVPRYVALSLLGLGARTGLIDSFSALYTAASRYESPLGDPAFTEGSWRPRAIPTIGEDVSPSARSVLVVSAGFEGEHTRRLVNALEPDRVVLALTTGIQDDHDKTARRASALVAEEYLVDTDSVLYLPANDVAKSLEVLDAALSPIISDRRSPTAVSFVLCGTKISALAMSLYAIDHPIAQVYYSDPERRVESSAVEMEWYTLVTVSP